MSRCSSLGRRFAPGFTPSLQVLAAVVLALLAGSLVDAQEAPKPPAGWRAIFNGKDLTGWKGLNPHSVVKLAGEAKEANLKQQQVDFPKHWTIEAGELVNDGHGPYATTEEDFGDIDLRLEYKTVAKADSGIYLRGSPRVQIWDWNQPYDSKNPGRRPHLGSGGLYNNTVGGPGRDPLVFADKPLGEWNAVRIRQIGDRTWVWWNDQRVVDGAPLANFWDRDQPLPAKGPILLQTHGGEIRWRNVFVREIPAEEGQAWIKAQDSSPDPQAQLSRALTLHASFDEGVDADFARADRTCLFRLPSKEFVRGTPTPEVTLDASGGRFGGALHFVKKSNTRPEYRNAGVLKYGKGPWNATVSTWLRLDPDKDLEPGYCDPVQIVGDDLKKGFVFLEWSKDETPRVFRYAIRPLFHLWNPDNKQWAELPPEKRPSIDVAKAGFSREAWTHVVFTLENINDKTKPPAGRLYLNGKPQGVIEKWDLSIDWDPAQVMLVLGASYVGRMDDLAVFDRVLSADEVGLLYGLKEGVRQLYPSRASAALPDK